MSALLTINSVCVKKQIYPMVLHFQNGYPSENFEFDCALIQDEDGNKAIATEIDRLLYVGNEDTGDLGQTFLLARNRQTGKVRLIEAGCASLKPFSEYAIQEPENSVLEPDKPDYLQRRNTNRRNHTPEKETNYEQVKNNSQILESSELETNVLAQNHQQLKASELEPKGANRSPLSEHNDVEPNISNHLQSLETNELGCNRTKHSPLLEASELKLKTKELHLNTLNDDKDYSTVKEMFVRALGLNIKVGETVYSENNVHSSPANNNKQKIYVIQNASDDDFNMASFVSKTYICAYCNKTFNDKGSIIFHLISHKFIMNTKNAVPKPIVKRIVGTIKSNDNYINMKRRRYNNERSVKKINYSKTSEKTKVMNENVLKRCDGDDDDIYKDVKVPGNDSVIIQDIQNMQILHNEIQVTENLEDFGDGSPILFAEKNFVLNCPSAPERNVICDHCDETFQEKESLIFHLLTHKFKNDMINIIMTNSDTNEDYIEIETVKANDYYKLERENEEKSKNIRIDKIHEERDSNDRIAKRVMHLVAHKSINDTINTRESRIITAENEPIQEHNEIETLRVLSPNRQPKVNCDDELEIKIRTDNICEARNSSVKNNTEQTIRETVAQMKTRTNDTHIVSNKKSTAVDNTFICNDCGRKSKSKLSLITHVKCHNSSIKAKKKDVTTLFQHIKLGVKEHGKNSNTETKKKGITLKLPLIKLTRCDFLNHLNENLASEKTYKFCTLCKYKTPYASRLTRHKRAHTKSFECEHCKKRFRNCNDLKVHLRCHSGDKPFHCGCGATFAKKNTLNRHLKMHTGEKPYNCTICSSKFNLLNGLKRHLIIHGEKTFKCTSCESSFSDGSSMKRHMRNHTGQKPYGCDSCKYSTANSHDLKRHAKTCQGRLRATRQL